MKKTFFILGGYGNTGRLIAELLLVETKVQLVLAGRNLKKAQAQTQLFNRKFQGNRVSAWQVNAADFNSLKNAFALVDFVIVASSTTAYVENVAKAALATGIDYLDTQISTIDKIKTLRSLQGDITQAGCCFITDGGFHPGIPAMLIRYAIPYFDRIDTANVASIMQLNWKKLSFSEATLTEFVKELNNYQPFVWQEKWVKRGWDGYKKFNFGTVFGKRDCVPMFMEELRTLPNTIPSLKKMGFFMAGFNKFTDYVVMPTTLTLLNLSSNTAKPLGKLFRWSVNTFSKPPYGLVIMLEASGFKDGKPLNLQIKLLHDDPYFLTAVPVVACLLQYIDGDINKPGLWYQANVVNPKRMLSDIEGLGIMVEIKEKL
ncbi:saccharopine dehydrogenase NADP-binding domain-containing protein [Candidatus Parabeggiatoa sp. HSG14]|uniref:saccharopine dehydrogenase family protein n=1 Tax=Candidatus Parabeggiatoa sp. HSG14 TaxID=3055593 RepID=UPI0025A6A949|nr:saccharopine dehydrogenase NADP-binding domain-containing protein [Thiotrichales bacterium HSG14]